MLDTSKMDSGVTKHCVDNFDATVLLCAPFSVVLVNAVTQYRSADGVVLETVIPDPDGLVKAVAQSRCLHPEKLKPADIKFLRSALEMKGTEFAKKIGITPEHLSRLESGDRVLQMQCETLIRTMAFTFTCGVHGVKDRPISEFAKRFSKLFDGVKPVKLVGSPPLVISLVRVPGMLLDDSDSDGLWDANELAVA